MQLSTIRISSVELDHGNGFASCNDYKDIITTLTASVPWQQQSIDQRKLIAKASAGSYSFKENVKRKEFKCKQNKTNKQ